MSGPPNRKPGQAPTGRSPAEIEAEMRDQAIQLAMMADLGIERVEELPLDEESRDRPRGQNARHAAANSRRGPPLPRGPPAQPSLSGGNGAAWGMNQVWQDAMAANIFDDDEAETVKNLDDLGGGRLYENAAAAAATAVAGSQRARVSHMTLRILDQRKARSGNHAAGNPAPNKGSRPNQGLVQTNRNNNRAAVNPSSHRGNNNRAPAPSANTKPKAININPRQKLAKQPRAQPVRTSTAALPMPATTIDPDAPLSFEIENVILKVVVNFSSRDINPALPALIVLSAAAPPELGFLTVVIYKSKYCEWAISAWFDYSTGDDNLLNIILQSDGVQQGYGLQFDNHSDIVKFINTVRTLQSGKLPSQVGPGLVPAPTVITALPTNASLQAATPQAPAPPNVPPANRTAVVPAAVPEPIRTAVSEPIPAAVPEPTAGPSTLNADDADASSQAFRDAAIVTCRTLLQFFHHSRAATNGTTTTVGDMDQTAAGIRAAVLQHTVDTARAEGVSEQKVQMITDAINEYFASLSAGRETERAPINSRPIYSIEFLMSRRDAAVSPPRSMANIPHLPLPGFSSQNRAASHKKATVDQSQVSRSADAMQWVLSEAAPKKPGTYNSGPNTALVAPTTAQATAPSVVGFGGTPDMGLQNSRWASGTQELKHANFFTGPRYEKAWSKRSFLEDLAQLDPQAEVTAGTEDIMDYFFPLPGAGRAQPGSQESAVDGNRVSTGSAMEDLSVDMSRLTIQSPTAPRMQSSRLAASAEATGYAARQHRELCTQPTSTGSTPSASYLEAQPTLRPSTEATRPTPTASTLSTAYLKAQATSRPSAVTPRPTPTASSLSPVSTAAQVSNGLRPSPMAAQTAPLTPAEPPRSAPTQSLPAASAQQPAAPAAQPRVRGLAASRHSDGTGPSSSGNFDFYLPDSARR